MQDHSSEIWKDIKGYEGFYQVSDQGRVKSLARRAKIGNGRTRIVRERILIPGKMKKGYLLVNFSRNGKTKIFLIHWLVLEAFVCSRPQGYQGLHKDDIPTNNRVDNLYWGTPKRNMRDAFKNERIKTGEKNPRSKSTNAEVRKIRELYSTGQYLQKDLAEMFSRNFVWIHNVVRYKKRIHD